MEAGVGGGGGGLLLLLQRSRKICKSTRKHVLCWVLPAGYLLGDSGGVVNSLDFCPASLKSLGCFYFRCVLSSQWQAVTVNLRILNCQL